MAQNYGLGRGLASLIPKKNQATAPGGDSMPTQAAKQSTESDGRGQVLEVDVTRIVPNPQQPRLTFDEGKIQELADSIKIHGIIQPLVVSKIASGYEIIAGERRFQAAKKAGLTQVPVVIRAAEEKEKLELAIIENVQRHDLNAVEEARAYKKLMDDYQMHQDEVADKVGKSRSAVANKMRLLNLPVEIQKALIEGRITEGHAKAILALENPEKQRALFELILKNNLTVRQTEDRTKEVSVRSHKRTLTVDPAIQDLQDRLVGIFGTKVGVVKSGEGGKIVINFYSQEELEVILGKIKDL